MDVAERIGEANEKFKEAIRLAKWGRDAIALHE